jgi:hypothetical protein
MIDIEEAGLEEVTCKTKNRLYAKDYRNLRVLPSGWGATAGSYGSLWYSHGLCENSFPELN